MDSFDPKILKTADGADVVYYAVWDSCTRPSDENVEYKYEKTKHSIKIIAKHTLNPRIQYIGTEQKTDRVYKLLMEKEKGLEVVQAKFFRFKPVVQKTEQEKVVVSQEENKEQLMKFTSKRMQKADSARKRRAIGVGVEDAQKLKQVKVEESQIKREMKQEPDSKPDDTNEQKEQDDDVVIIKPEAVSDPDVPYTSVSDLMDRVLNKGAKNGSEMFREDAILSSSTRSMLTDYAATTTPDSLSTDYFKDLFEKAKSDSDKGMAVFADCLVRISKIRGGAAYADDPLPELTDPLIKDHLMHRFTDQTSATKGSSTRSRLKWHVTDKQKDVIIALTLIMMHKLSGKKFVPVTSATRLLSVQAKQVVKVAQVLGCRLDRPSGSAVDLYFEPPSEKKESDKKPKVVRRSRR